MNGQPPSERGDDQPAPYVPVVLTPVKHSPWIRWAVGLGLLAFATIFLFADLHELWRILTHANFLLLPLPILCVGLSYLTMARSYQGIASAAGWKIPMREMLKITFVANTTNYLVATAGLSGFAVRMYYFTRLSIPSGSAVIISLAQTFLTNVTLLLFVLGAFLYVFSTHTLHGPALAVTTVLLVLVVLAALTTSILLFHARLRRRVLFWTAQGAYWLLHRLLPKHAPRRTHIWRYQFNLNRGVAFLLSRKDQMLGPLFYILLDWIFTILILYTAFLTVRYPVRLGYVIVGFAVGFILSFASLIPAGLGVMEGSMAAIFTSMDVPFETAVVAIILFRLSYYLLPLLISLFFLHGMFVQATHLGSETPRRAPPAG